MKNRGTKERRILRQEFVYRHVDFFIKYQKVYFEDVVKVFVDHVVRKEIPYSCKTNSLDIWIFLRRTFENLFTP